MNTPENQRLIDLLLEDVAVIDEMLAIYRAGIEEKEASALQRLQVKRDELSKQIKAAETAAQEVGNV